MGPSQYPRPQPGDESQQGRTDTGPLPEGGAAAATGRVAEGGRHSASATYTSGSGSPVAGPCGHLGSEETTMTPPDLSSSTSAVRRSCAS